MLLSPAYSPVSLGISSEEEAVVTDTLREFGALQIWRNVHAATWEETAALILPSYRNTFFYGGFNMPGLKKTEQQVDASGMMALHRFAAIMDSLLTPRNQIWHGLEADDPYVMKDRQTRLWFEDVTRRLFKYRYAPHANFASQNQNLYQSLGAFGTGPMFVDAFDGGPGLRYHSGSLGEWFIKQNHQGIVNGFIRWFRLTAEQAKQKWPNKTVPQLETAAVQHNQMQFNFLHRVVERDSYDPDRWDAKGKKYASQYVCIEGKCMMQPEGGYRTFPLMASRYEQAPIEVYGRGPATMVLPALKTLNAQKRVFLKQGHRAADPVLLTSDDGLVDFNLRPGALNKGGVSSDGKPLVHALPAGNIEITKEQMELEKGLINDAFLVSLFQILTETPTMTATEVVERTNEKGILVAPTSGRQQSEYLGPLIDRELDVLSAQRLLPPMPPRLREAKGSYAVVYKSPLARAARSQEAAGFMRTVEHGKELVAITQDASILDPLNMDKGMMGIAEIQGVPESWMATEEEIANKRKARAKAQQAQQQIQAMPAQAAMVKAQAVAAKEGQGQPQGAPQ